MSENKFIQHLKGKATAGSVVEIKNQATPASFANMPSGTSNANNVYADVRGNATVVAQGTTNWKLDSANLVLASSVSGDGNDYTGVYGASGAGLWVNATYTFPSTGDPNHPVAMIFNPNTKWVLKLCGDNLLANGASTIGFSLVITIGSTNIITKNFIVAEQANKFCKEFVIDFAESNADLIKAQGLSTMQVQLLCATASATARIYNGMTVFTTLQRKVDASTVSADFANVEEVLRDGILPSDYFSNAEFIDEIDDGEQAYAVFERDGDDVNLAGWTPKDDIATTTQLNDEITARENADLGLQNQINTNKDTMDGHIANTSNPHQVTKAQVGLGNVDNTSDLNKPISTATQTALDGKQAKSASAYNMGNASGGWTAMTAGQQNALNSGATTTNIGQIATNTTNIANEIIDRQNADNGLQTQIDAIVSKSDVVDIVGTYAELQAYDTSTLGNNDVVKVISDSTHNNAPSYYRWVITGGVGAWVYIGSEAETYTKAETDALLNNKQDTISDLATIRAGAALGATALQAGDNVSELVNDAGYLTQHQTLADLGITATASEINVLDGITASTAELNYTDGVTSNIQTQLNGKQATISDLATIRSGAALGATAVQPGDLATVATSGSYNDLSNKPTIPTVNNPTITITQGGVPKGSFSLNQASDDTIALDAGGGSGLPDQTGHAGEFLTTDGTDASWSDAIGYHPDLFDWKWADHQINDVQWLRADTFSWQSGAVYQAAYQHLADDIDGKTLQSETVGGVTVQFYLADDGHKICPDSQESNVASIFTATGVAWYYIIDTVNERFKLPRTKFGFTGIRTGVGEFVEAGLPDIQGYNGTNLSDSGTPSGAFQNQGRVAGNGGGSGNQYRMNFYAHLYNSIYGNSDTVQPKATQMYLYFYVGNFTQTALENTAGLNASLFNGKADIDLTNVSAAGKALAIGWGLPDYTAGVSVSSGYTATEKCWLFTHNVASGGNGANGYAYTYVNGFKISDTYVSNWNYNTYNDNMVPLDVGDVVTTDVLRGSASLVILPMKGV